MMRTFAKRRGQSTAEYAVVVGVVIAAVVAMQIYVKRGLQAKVRDVTDDFTQTVGSTSQYEPYYASSDYDITQTRDSTEAVSKGGVVARTGISETTTRTGSATTGTDQGADAGWQ